MWKTELVEYDDFAYRSALTVFSSSARIFSKQYHWVDGRIYKGQWVAGKAHGYGTETRPDGSIRHDGQWENDRPIN